MTPGGRRKAATGMAPTAEARPRVRGSAGGAEYPPVEYDVRTPYDFVLSLSLAAEAEESDLLAEDEAWIADRRSALPAQVRGQLTSCYEAPFVGAIHVLPSVIVDNPGLRDAAALTDAIDAITPRDVVHRFLADYLPRSDVDAMTDRVIAGDAGIIEEVRARLDASWGKGQMAAILEDPLPAIEAMRRVLRAWLPIYQEVEPRMRRMIERDVESRAADQATLEPGDLIERTTGGLRWLPEPGVRRVVLAPSYFVRPFNHVDTSMEWRLFIYPVADAVLDAPGVATPPPAMVRLYRALGDSSRMRILRLLADRDLYLTEIATALDVSKPTAKHHMAVLRAAGLVTVTEEGALTWFHLRRERLDEAGTELRRFLD
jgi:DNA-binding transcriptional ArsR family regulator